MLAGTLGFAQLEPTETEALLTVEVINKSTSSKEGELVEFVAQKTGKKYSGVTDLSGKFSVLIPEGDKYRVIYKAFNQAKEQELLDVPSEEGTTIFEFSLIVNAPKIFTLNNVLFETGKPTLKPESKKELDELAEYMKRKKSLKFEIAGHTDNVGNAALNNKLSEDRAKAVKDYLVKKGVDPARLIEKGYGSSMPVADNNTEEGRKLNRRTEARVISD